jgi:signal transduction histidine kinase
MRRFFFRFLPFALVLAVLQPTKGLQAQQSVRPESEIAIRDSSYLRMLNEKAADFLTSGRMDSAFTSIQEALSLSEILNDPDGRAYALSNLGNYYLSRGLPDSTIANLSSAYHELKSTSRGSHLGNILATAYYRIDNFDESLRLYREALDIARRQDNARLQAAITQNMGNTYSDLGEVPDAVDSYLKSLELAEALGDSNTIAVVLDNLGTINTDENNFELAEEYLLKALDMSRDLGNPNYKITNHMNLGILYKEMGRYEESQAEYEQAIEIAESIGNVYAPIQARYNLGELLKQMGEFDEAMEYFRSSMEMSRVNNILIGTYYNSGGIGDIHRNRGDFDEAAEMYLESLRIAEQLGSNSLILPALGRLYEAYEESGDTLSAYGYLKEYMAISDSISTREREQALARQESILELRSERERSQLLEETVAGQRWYVIIISILLGILLIALVAYALLYRKKRKANQLLEKRTEELSNVNQAKDKLLSVLAHDLRTPLSGLQGVVYLIREKVISKEDMDAALNEIDSQLQQGINTLTNYLEWAQNQKNEITADLKNVRLEKILDEAIGEMTKSAQQKNVQIVNRTEPEITVSADPHMMSVILRNLLSNAVKFVDERGSVTIETKEEGDRVELSISNDGKGIEPEKLKSIFEPFKRVSRGTREEVGTGLGLSICRDFVEKQGGEISCDSKPGEGTTFTLKLKKIAAPLAEKA